MVQYLCFCVISCIPRSILLSQMQGREWPGDRSLTPSLPRTMSLSPSPTRSLTVRCLLSPLPPVTVHVVPPYYRRVMWTGTQSWGCGLWNVAWLHLPLTPWLGSIIIRYNGPSPLSALVNYRLTVWNAANVIQSATRAFWLTFYYCIRLI